MVLVLRHSNKNRSKNYVIIGILFNIIKRYHYAFVLSLRPLADRKIVQIAPGYPVQNSPVKARMYISLNNGTNTSVTLNVAKVQTFLGDFVQNASDALSLQVSGNHY